MTARDYRVTFPYGKTSDPYTPASPHRGDDYPTPKGTPIVIGSTTIGTTGDTGYVFGAHLHVQEWQGNASVTRKPQNAFKGGTVVDLSTNKDQGSWGRFITIQKDGWNTTYAHLDTINVSRGQVITEGNGDMIGSGDNWFARLNQLHQQLLGRPLSREVFNHFVGKDLLTFVETVSDHPETYAREALETTWETFYATWNTKKELSDRPTKQQLDDLQAQLKTVSQKVTEAEKKLAEEQAKPPITNTVEIEKKLTISDHITAILSYIKGIFKR